MTSCDNKLEQFLNQLVLAIKLDLFILFFKLIIVICCNECNNFTMYGSAHRQTRRDATRRSLFKIATQFQTYLLSDKVYTRKLVELRHGVSLHVA